MILTYLVSVLFTFYILGYRGRTAPLTFKRCILYIYSTNIGTEYFKHGIYSPLYSSSKCSLFHNSNVFRSCVIQILYTGCAKIKKNNSGAKRLRWRDGRALSGICGSAGGRLKGSSERGNRTVRYIKRFGVGICWPVQELPASQESLCVTE